MPLFGEVMPLFGEGLPRTEEGLDFTLEEDWPVPEECRPHLGDEDGVDAAQLGVDLEAEVGEHLRRRTGHILGLDALGGDAQHTVTHPLHLKKPVFVFDQGLTMTLYINKSAPTHVVPRYQSEDFTMIRCLRSIK
jgi:hypothetical protein